MRKIAVRTKKGGVGKTTTVANIGYFLASIGKRVCLVDCDSQYNLTTSLGIDQSRVNGTILSFLKGSPIDDILIEARKNLYLIGSNKTLRDQSHAFDTRIPELSLRTKWKDLAPWDFLIFDCPPGSSMLIDNVLCTVDEIWSTMQLEFLSFEGVEQILEEISELNEAFSPLGVHTQVSAIIPTMADTRLNITKEVQDASKNRYGEILSPAIRRNIRIGEAPAFGQTIFEYDPISNGAKDYKILAEYLINLK